MSDDTVTVDGHWILTIRTPMGPQVGRLDLTTAGGSLAGTFKIRDETHPLRDGTVQDGDLAWNVRLRKPIPMTAKFTASVEGRDMTGVAKIGPMGEAPFQGRPDDAA
jgi:hypothetical protein